MKQRIAIHAAAGIPDRAAYLELVAASIAPCAAFVHDDPAAAREAIELVFDTGYAEFCPPRGIAYVDDAGRTVAISVGMERDEQVRAGMQTAMVLRKSGFADRHPDIMDRLRQVAGTLIRPDTGAYYWSQTAVAPTAQGGGIGSQLTQGAIDEARRRGCKRIVGLMVPGSPIAGILERHGFVEYERKRVEDPARGRSVEYIHLSRDL
jgi:GNAT superfamily N-acetyltransferase